MKEGGELEQLVAGHGIQEEGRSKEDGAAEAAASKIELTVDEIIEEYVGSFGFSQLLQVFMVSLVWMFDSQNTLVTIFSDFQPSWKCSGSSSSSSSSSSPLCDGAASPSSLCKMDPVTWEWEGGKESSTVAEWGLICGDRFRAATPASMFFIGSVLGSTVHGRLRDALLGRKKTLLLSCLLTSISAFATSLSPNLWFYALLRFANGFARSGIRACCHALSKELLGRNCQDEVGHYSFFFYTAGLLSLALMAYPTKDSWRNIYKIISLPPLFYSFSLLPFVLESPRWLAGRGRTEDAMEVLDKLARLNGKKLPKNIAISGTKANEPNSSQSLWHVRGAAKRMVTVMITGFGTGFVYYGVQLNAENLNFDLYLAVALNALMEIPAALVGSVLLGFMERRVLFSLSASIAGSSCILCIFLSGQNLGGDGRIDSGDGGWLQLAAEAVGFMAASLALDVLYIYCAEMFPKNARNQAVSILRQAMMLGAAFSPVLVVLGRESSSSISFLMFGCSAIVCGFLACWLPETRNAALYESPEQQESLASETELEFGSSTTS